jgi:F-type H+-transporting ATPase subunit b
MIQEFLQSNIASFLWALSAFVVFVLVFYRLGVKHILAAVDARDRKIAADLKEAEDINAQAKALKSELDAKMKAAESKVTALMAEANRNAEAARSAMIEKGRQEVEHLRHRALQDIDAARNAALIELRNQIADLVVVVAEKSIHERLDQSKQEALVEAAIAAVGKKG